MTDTESRLTMHVCRTLLEWTIAVVGALKTVLIKWETAGNYAITTLKRAAGAPKPQQDLVEDLLSYMCLSILVNMVLGLVLLRMLLKKLGAVDKEDKKVTLTLPM
jgi:hypothetical protein